MHIQDRSGDYKEMCAAGLALTLSCIHLLRTASGLWQLKCFKKWIKESVESIELLGYKVTKEKIDIFSDTILVSNKLIDNRLRNCR